jgi:transcription initiation factor TFIID subunit 11
MIEGARKVQTQWLEASGETQLPSPPYEGGSNGQGSTQGSSQEKGKETRRGPLLPEHLREAFRRHMLEGTGGLVGELGLWQHQTPIPAPLLHQK